MAGGIPIPLLMSREWEALTLALIKNDLVDENIEKGMKTTNQEERKEYYLNVAKQINEDVPMIFLYAQDREIMCNPKLENFDPYTFNIFCDIWEWDFAQ